MIQKTIKGIAAIITLNSALYATVPTLENVTKLYVATFNRAPDAAGLEYWITTPDLTLESIARYFFDQPETQRTYPPESTTLDFVTAVYSNLFNRTPDQAGLDYWVEELDSGRVSKSTFILYVIGGAQNDDATIMANKTTVGQAYVSVNYNNTTWAKEVMAPVNASQASVDKSISMIRGFTNTTCINNYFQRNDPSLGMSLCVENLTQETCESYVQPDDIYDAYAIMIPKTCIEAGYPEETRSPDNIYYGYEMYTGTKYPVQTGDITNTDFMENIRESLAQTSGAMVQAILSINTFLYTNNANTPIETFKKRKQQADQALSILESKASTMDGYLNMLASETQTREYITANYSTITPEEVEAVLNSSKMKGVLKPLMAHYHVGARKAKEILDNAMSNLYTKYTKEADNYETATNVAKVVRDGAGLTLTIGATVATAGTAGGLGVLGGVSSLIQGADGVVKLSKSTAELIIGEDGALDDTYKHSGLVGGLSAASEMLAITSLFSKAGHLEEVVSRIYYMSSKTREFVQDEVIAFGPASVNYGDFLRWKPNREDYLRMLNHKYKHIIAYPSDKGYRSGTKALTVDKEALKKLVEKPLKALPDDSRVQGTTDLVGGGDNVDMKWASWPFPEWCPQTYSLTLNNVIYYLSGFIMHVGDHDIACEYMPAEDGAPIWSEIPHKGSAFGDNWLRDDNYDGYFKAWNDGTLSIVRLYEDGNLITSETY